MHDGITWADSVLSQAASWKCSGKVFTPSLVSLWQCSFIHFHPNLLPCGTKARLLLLAPSAKTWSQLCSSGDLSLQADEWLHRQQQELCISELILLESLLTWGSTSPLMPMYLPPWLPSLAQSVLTAGHLLRPRVLLRPCICLPFLLVFEVSAYCASVYA